MSSAPLAVATVLAAATLPVVATLLAACAVVPAERPPLNISNGTTLELTLVVNGLAVATYGPGEGTSSDGFAGPLPPLPWTVLATTRSGRVLATMTVNPGDVNETTSDGAQSMRGRLARVDLSCGRLDLWAGRAQPLGPAPGPGVPGDCAP
jgi:hypothetical protein